MKWAVEKQGLTLRESMCEHAIREGNLPLLMWLREHRCPWNERTLMNALNGRIRDNAIHSKSFLITEVGGCIEWALNNGCPRPPRPEVGEEMDEGEEEDEEDEDEDMPDVIDLVEEDSDNENELFQPFQPRLVPLLHAQANVNPPA